MTPLIVLHVRYPCCGRRTRNLSAGSNQRDCSCGTRWRVMVEPVADKLQVKLSVPTFTAAWTFIEHYAVPERRVAKDKGKKVPRAHR